MSSNETPQQTDVFDVTEEEMNEISGDDDDDSSEDGQQTHPRQQVIHRIPDTSLLDNDESFGSDNTECTGNRTPSPQKQRNFFANMGGNRAPQGVEAAGNAINRFRFQTNQVFQKEGFQKFSKRIRGDLKKTLNQTEKAFHAANNAATKSPQRAPLSPGRISSPASMTTTTGIPRARSGSSGGNETFHGRYANSNNSPRSSPSSRMLGRKSQAEIILNSRAGAHVENVMRNVLKDKDEYMILLGPGPLGAYLKDIYSDTYGNQRHGSTKASNNMGVYVDLLVPGGAAEKSGLVDIGDRILRVGENDVSNGSIDTVPKMIAKAARPLVVVLSRIHVPSNPPSAIDVAIVDVFRVQEEAARVANEETLTSAPIFAPRLDDSTTGSASSNDDDDDQKDFDLLDVSASQHLNGLQKKSEKRSFAALSRAVQREPTFCDNLRAAFVECCLDQRRLPFITAYVAGEDATLNATSDEPNKIPKRGPSESIKLIFWLEIQAFVDLWGVTPVRRRRAHAQRIFHKFLGAEEAPHDNEHNDESFDSDVDEATLTPQMFNLRSKLVHTGILETLERVLNDDSIVISHDIFYECQRYVEDDLCGARFASFLDSDEGARMRAYLMCATPYHHIPLDALLQPAIKGDAYVTNYFYFIVVHLICEGGLSGGLCTALFLKRRMLPSFQREGVAFSELVNSLTYLWNLYLAPDCGALEKLTHSSHCEVSIACARSTLLEAFIPAQSLSDDEELFKRLTDDKVVQSLSNLAEELIFDYAVNHFPKFKQDRSFHLLCHELNNVLNESGDRLDISKCLPELPHLCVSRLLRKSGLPKSISAHRPLYDAAKKGMDDAMPNENVAELKQPPSTDLSISDLDLSTTSSSTVNAEYGIIFGTTVSSDDAETNDHVSTSSIPASINVERMGEIPFQFSSNKKVSLLETLGIPTTLEKYTKVPPKRRSPFKCTADRSNDGWEFSLVDFAVPHTSPNYPDGRVYGVSLVIQRNTYCEHYRDLSLCLEETPVTHREISKFDNQSVLPESIKSTMSPEMKEQMNKEKWSSQFSGDNGDLIGIALISSNNVIPSMRASLVALHDSIVGANEDVQGGDATTHLLNPLADLLGASMSEDVNPMSFKPILEPYLDIGSSTWIDRPISEQATFSEKRWGETLIDVLPPVSLALTFSALLLEQKVVMFSSRRSMLLACVQSINTFLRPLEWAHLIVPVVPDEMVVDLLQYPAPYIIGISSDSSNGNSWIDDLPDDVTLVDLDIGRVILASVLGDKADEDSTKTSALRSQVLYLSEELGRYIGHNICPQQWQCDMVPYPVNENTTKIREDRLKIVRSIFHSFMTELLYGVTNCCLWIEEIISSSSRKGKTNESTVLFDEDRFFHIKNIRAQKKQPLEIDLAKIKDKRNNHKLALSVDEFDLVLETCLRGQGMSTYISSQSRKTMMSC